MKQRSIWLAWGAGCLICAAVTSARGQVNLDLKTDYRRVLQFEPVWIDVTIENQLPTSLMIRAEHEGPHLDFRVRAQRSSFPVPRRGLSPPPAFVGPYESATLRVDLGAYYDLTKPGPYIIEALIELQGRVFLSPKKYVDVLSGAEVARRFYQNSVSGFQFAKLFSLYRAGYEHLLLRLDNSDETQCLAVLDLGTAIRLLPPTLLADEDGRVHVLHQAGPFQYLHSVISPPDAVLQQTLYFAHGSTPKLVEDIVEGWAVEGAQRVNEDFAPQ